MDLIDYIVANPALLAGICTIIGGILLKVVEKWLSKQAEQRNQRKDYREEIKELNERIDALEEDITQWRNRAFTAEEQVALLRIMLIKHGAEPPESIVQRP